MRYPKTSSKIGTAGKYKCKEGLKMLREMARAGMEPAIEYLNSIGQKY